MLENGRRFESASKERIKFKLSEKYAVTVVRYRSRAIFIQRVPREQSENNRS